MAFATARTLAQVAVPSKRRNEQPAADSAPPPPLLPELAPRVASPARAAPPVRRLASCRVPGCTSPPELMSRYQMRARYAPSPLAAAYKQSAA
jgi:hypothetical protein